MKVNSIKIKKYSDVLVVVLSLVILFLQSPFTLMKINEIQCIENPQFIYFIYIKSLFLFVVILVTLIIYFRFKKEVFIRKGSFYIWLYSLFYLLTRVPYGFDVTDQGFHLARSWFALGTNSSYGISFMSWLAGSVWLKLFGIPSLLWARLGYTLLVAGIIYLSSKIVFLYAVKSLKNIFIVFIVSVFFVHYNYYMTINYDNLPVLLGLIALYIILKDNAYDYEYARKEVLSRVAAGVFIGLGILSKISFCFALFIPLVLYHQSKMKDKKKKLIQVYSGVFAVFLTGFLFLAATGTVFDYSDTFTEALTKHDFSVESTYRVFDIFLTDSMKSLETRQGGAYYLSHESHSAKMLFLQYAGDVWKVLQITAVLFLVMLMTHTIFKFVRSKIFIYIILFFLSASVFYGNDTGFSDFPVLMTGLVSSILLLLVYTGKFDSNLKTLLMASYLLYFVSFLGSNVSFNTAFRSGGALLLFYSVAVLSANKFEGISKDFLPSKVNLSYNVAIMLLVMMISIKNVLWLDVHRDADRKFLNYMFRSPQLFGIFSTKERVNAVDELIEAVSKIDIEERDAVIISQFPMLHYVMDLKNILESPWAETEIFAKSVLYMESLDSNEQPSIVIISKFSGRSDHWPVTDVHSDQFKSRLKWRDYLEYFVRKNEYILGFENNVFRVYHK